MDEILLIRRLNALAQESRLAIVKLLLEHGAEGLFVTQIGKALSLAPATLSFHLKELSHAGLVEGRHEGRYIHYSANFYAMSEIVLGLTESCCVDSVNGNCLVPKNSKRKYSLTARSTRALPKNLA